MDTFWYIDPDHGIDGVWDNSLAAEKPIYNDDFTEMTVKLRPGIYWSDGVEFTADDVVYTIETHLDTDGLYWSAPVQINVAAVSAPDPLHRGLQAQEAELALPRAVHRALERDVDDAQAHLRAGGRSAPVRLQPAGLARAVHAAQLRSRTANGTSGAKRDDWQRTTLARFGEPGPKYAAYIDPGPPDKRVIAQLNHELDIIHDVAPEGMFTLARESDSSHGWFEGFPYAHPDPTLPALIFNTQNELFQDPRRALGAGAADRHQGRLDGLLSGCGDHLGDRRSRRPAPIPTYYHEPARGLARSSFEIDTGKRKIKPYDPTIGQQIAEMLRPSMGDADPERSGGDRPAPSVAAGGSPIRRPRPSCSRRPASPSSGDASGTRRTASRSRSASRSRARPAR